MQLKSDFSKRTDKKIIILFKLISGIFVEMEFIRLCPIWDLKVDRASTSAMRFIEFYRNLFNLEQIVLFIQNKVSMFDVRFLSRIH